MIISASYRTDIPAFHGNWFRARLGQGFVDVPNPYSAKTYRVSLAPADVDGFVFWTRNTRPFHAGLDAARLIAPFMVTYTLTGYPERLEQGVPPVAHAVREIARLARLYGPRAVVWRYDPVLWSDLTPPDFHRQNLARLADKLAPHVDEVTFSAATLYAKSVRNLKRMTPDVSVFDPDDTAKRDLLADLGEIAVAHGLRPTICSQPHLLSGPLQPAACIDTARLSGIGGQPVTARQKGNRPGCACAESRDVGHYDSCAHACVYCYAVRDHAKVVLGTASV
ncbi:MAG: DUF1848 domain-containing protein [Minwuia sp.]|nr:DUF1848 domain-containing protein [Minwuia sp.]